MFASTKVEKGGKREIGKRKTKRGRKGNQEMENDQLNVELYYDLY